MQDFYFKNIIFLVQLILNVINLTGLDGRFVSSDNYPGVCQARVWLLTLGFTLAYGAMFSKVWRVHRLTTKSKQDGKVIHEYYII
jgi:gamma-aminobutyric acid type B receptor